MGRYRWRDFNFYLLGSMLVLIGFSLLMVYSTMVGKNAVTYSGFRNHLIWLGIGGVCMVGVMLFDYRNLQVLGRPLYVLMLCLLGIVFALGINRQGAQSWVGFESLSFQPSEPAKLLLIIALAAWWSAREQKLMSNSWVTLIGSLVLAGIPLVMVLVQPDFGTAMVMGFIWLGMAWAAGMRWFHMLALAAVAIPGLVYGWQSVLEPYQQGRLLGFMSTEEQLAEITDPRVHDAISAVLYNVNQSKVAIGNGGLMGQGWNNGTQSQLNFLPVQYTDFIFAVTGEELGFVGATIMLGFLCFTIWQAVTVATRARETFGRLLAIGIASLMIIHTLENVGMNMGLMPVTGIPLPFVSYGGSFTITMLMAVGLLQSIEIRRQSHGFW
jgi:rod shape determining protein RodA